MDDAFEGSQDPLKGYLADDTSVIHMYKDRFVAHDLTINPLAGQTEGHQVEGCHRVLGAIPSANAAHRGKRRMDY